MKRVIKPAAALSYLLILTQLSAATSTPPPPLQAGQAYFQVQNIDASQGDKIDDTYYPRLAAPNKVSATFSFATDCTPANDIPPVYRLRAWMGGSMLWATGQQESDPTNGYFVARNVPSSNTWPAELFQQGPVIADPIILTYSQPPGLNPTTHTARGITLTLPYPYLTPDNAYGSSCQDANAFWQTAPLTVETDPIPTLLFYPATTAPVDGTLSDDTIWGPTAMLVDKMGDFSTDLIYQNPNNPYVRTPFSNTTGQGQYIKCTVVQGSPFVFFECVGVEFIALSNRITTSQVTAVPGLIAPATAPIAVPGVTNVQYSMLGGNQIDPGQFTESTTLNPLQTPTSLQDNFTTWGVYFKNDPGITFVPGSATTQPQNSYFQLSPTQQNQKFYFVVAGLPTIYGYPHAAAPFDQYSTAIVQPNYNIQAYAEGLGQYAFNFVTDTSVSYSVDQMTFLQSTYESTLTNAYNDPSMVAAASTIMCLMPHHYQNQTFASGVTPTVLGSVANFAPANTSSLFYWTVRGNLLPILGTSFQTNYVFSNFLPTMPTPYWTDCVNLTSSSGGTYATTTIGQLLFDSIDNEYISNLTDSNYAPWDTAYQTQDKGVYDVGKALAKAAKQLGLILHFLQGFEENTGGSDPFNTFFYAGTDPTSYLTCSSYATSQSCSTALQQLLYEQQFNNQAGKTDRPGAFNPQTFSPPSKGRLQSLQDSLKTSIIGSTATNPPISGVEGAISGYFNKIPVVCSGGYHLSHYAYYDTLAHMVMLYPSAGTPPSGGAITPWPGRVQTPPNHFGPGIVLESFGVADAFNDHHYQYGYWISAAAMAGIYDGAWLSTPTSGSQWVSSSNYGTAIDQLVKDIAYDPAIASTFYSDNKNLMYFAKLNFFDQWAGHGWADGIQATIAGGNSGHNENSIGEALQAYASIILWGMATERKEIVDLGIYLYTTTAYAMDSYFFDKNLNYAKGQSPQTAFVPVSTATTFTQYPAGSAFIDFTIHSTDGSGNPTSSGTPKISQAVVNYSADFGQTPENIKLITAFPCSAWSLVFGRNQAYLNAWNASMDTCPFNETITLPVQTSTDCWQTAFVANMNMLRALGGNATAFGISQTTPCPPYTAPTISPYDYMLELLTMWGGAQGCPPWGSIGGTFLDPSQSINEVLHFLHTIDHYGTPEWSVYGRCSTDHDTLVFTAAFTKGGTTTYFVFNPTLAPIQVEFCDVLTKTPLVPAKTATVQPKRWSKI